VTWRVERAIQNLVMTSHGRRSCFTSCDVNTAHPCAGKLRKKIPMLSLWRKAKTRGGMIRSTALKVQGELATGGGRRRRRWGRAQSPLTKGHGNWVSRAGWKQCTGPGPQRLPWTTRPGFRQGKPGVDRPGGSDWRGRFKEMHA
jgi:hypothetical protein